MNKKDIEKQIAKSGWASLTQKQKDYYDSTVNETSKGISEIIYNEACRCLGRDISPRENEYACMESVNSLLLFATGQPINNSTSTADGLRTMQGSSRFVEIKEPVERGTIWIFATGTSTFKPTKTIKKNPIECGHILILMDDGVLASNDSKTSLFRKNYTIATAKARWMDKGKYPLHIFRVRG